MREDTENPRNFYTNVADFCSNNERSIVSNVIGGISIAGLAALIGLEYFTDCKTYGLAWIADMTLVSAFVFYKILTYYEKRKNKE